MHVIFWEKSVNMDLRYVFEMNKVFVEGYGVRMRKTLLEMFEIVKTQPIKTLMFTL
jgi:hypothetical protein